MILEIDGCPAGWYVARTASTGAISSQVYPHFSDILTDTPSGAVIAVDIPIGLNEAGNRPCDELARTALAPKRSSSVFPAPLRAVLDAASHSEASAIHRGIDGREMSIQAFGITRKVREADLAMDAHPQHHCVYEVHPELCFMHLNGGQPMSFSKRTSAGRAERLRLLAGQFGDVSRKLVEKRVRRDVGTADVLDALVALWSAIRISRGQHISLPTVPGRDARGRRMAISY